MSHTTAAILSIGDELTLGQSLDTNSQWLSRRLTEIGVVPVEHATVPDSLRATREAIARLAKAADVVIVTGGLGPTADDLTRGALAGAMGQDLVKDEGALEQIRAWFASRSRPMPELNRVQAQRPRGAAMIENKWGTAPGLAGEVGGVEVFCLPGPPREMRPMFEAAVVPRLRPVKRVLTRAVLTFGMGESDIATKLGEMMARERSPMVGTTASKGVVAVRIRSERPVGEAGVGEREIAVTEAEVREKLGPYAFGVDGETQASALLDELKGQGKRLATVESCTGGLLGQLITDVPGSSKAYVGGWVTYTNELKEKLVGVPRTLFERGGPGAVSRECAEAMAIGGRERSGADVCVAITGIAGPDGGTEEKPVGTVWIATAWPSIVRARRFVFTGERENIRDWAARSALAITWMEAVGVPGYPLLRQVEPR